MGEFDEKRTKTDTSITVVGKLTRLVDLQQTLANEGIFFQFGSLFGLGICENQKQPNQQFNGQVNLLLEVRTMIRPQQHL